MTIDDAAETLRGRVTEVIAMEKAKENTIRQAFNRVDATQEELTEQVDNLSDEVRALRDRLQQQIRSWCDLHTQRLEAVGARHQKELLQQQEDLQAQMDAVSSHRQNLVAAMSGVKALHDVVPVCLRLMQKVSHNPVCDHIARGG